VQLDVKLKKKVGDFQLDTDFSLSGRRIGIFGPSGSGKSTLMNLLAGLIQADSGYIRLEETVLFDSSKKINLMPEKRRVGVVFQHAHLFPHMSVRSNVLYGWKRTRSENRHIDPEMLSEVLGIGPLLERSVRTLSGGERQRVALARTMLSCPRLILMDEPLSGLDENLKFQIIPYLKRVFTEFQIPLLFISHSMLEMRLMTEEVLVVEQGCIKQQLATEELARSSWNYGRQGYVNLLKLGPSSPHHDLYLCQWGDTNLILTEPGEKEENLYELDAREIILFKRHPEATSARNLLKCRVRQVYMSGNRARVELACSENLLIAQIVPESVRELQIEPGSEVIAAIKASVFKKII
jgi:molybdate transport system ATP-binding protein